MRRRAVIWFVSLLGLGAACYIYSTDRLVFDRPQKWVDQRADDIREQLKADGLVMLVTFDKGNPWEWVHRAVVSQSGVEYVQGPTGGARRFDGHQRSFIETAVPWLALEDSFTLSVWVKLDSISANQDILFSSLGGVQVGLKLDQGNMAFFIPATPAHRQVVAYPFERYDEFVHLVAVADAQSGKAYLYEDGNLMATDDIDATFPVYHNVEFGKRRWFGVRHPLNGDLGESAIWARALTREEVDGLSERRTSLLNQIASRSYRSWRRASATKRGLHRLLKNIDYFHPGLHEGRLEDADLPDLHLYLTQSDLRHFRRTHARSMHAGRRTRQAAAPRAIHMVNEGRAIEASLFLHGANQWYTSRGRKGFILDVEDSASWLGMRRVRLVPPEDEDFLRPLLKRRAMKTLNLPSLQNGFCRLYINDELQGVYLFEDYERLGMFPGRGGELFWGPLLPRDWYSRFHRLGVPDFAHVPLADAIPITEKTLFRLHDDLANRYRAVLMNDTKSLLSSREIEYQLKWGRRRIRADWRLAPEDRPPAQLASDWLTPFVVLGENPSPFFIVDDLPLQQLCVPGLSIMWHSSHPDILTHAGKVTRPEGDLPIAVTLSATITDGSNGQETHETSFILRVMPQQRRLPAIMLWVNETINKIARVETDAYYYPSESDTPTMLRGSQETNGGLSHRGHTGYWLPRKAFSLRLDEPHFLLDDSPTRHIYLINAGRDPSGIRNRLSYDIFRSLSSPGQPRHAPEVRWAEVFINGHYHGLMEMTRRIHRRMLGWDAYDPDTAHNGLILKHENMPAWSTGSRIYMRQVFPPRRHGYFFETYLDLLDFVSTADPETFADELEDRMDVENIIDFHLFVNLIENLNGQPFNFWFHEYLIRDPGQDGRFFFAAWDLDYTYRKRDIWVADRLFRRMEADYPDYASRLRTRWRELRDGPLASGLLLERLAIMEADLAGYIEWNFERWYPQAKLCHAALVDKIRSHIVWRLDRMDHLLEKCVAALSDPK